MKTKTNDPQTVTVTLYLSCGNKEEQVAAVQKMLNRYHPITVGKKVIFLDDFKVLD